MDHLVAELRESAGTECVLAADLALDRTTDVASGLRPRFADHRRAVLNGGDSRIDAPRGATPEPI